MKRKIAAALFLLAAMALLPVIVVSCSVNHLSAFSTSATVDEAQKNTSGIETDSEARRVVCAAAENICNEDFNDEALKAALILVNSNYAADKNSVEAGDISDNELYSRLERIFDSNLELLYYQNETKYVPYSQSSNGYTVNSDTYAYLCAVASPWDCYAEDYDKNAKCEGVSLNGIRYLCENGVSSEDALLWYLPNFEIKKLDRS